MFRLLTVVICLSAMLADVAPAQAGHRRSTTRYPRVYGYFGRPYGPTQAYYQYRRQYGRPWHGYGGINTSYRFGTPFGAARYRSNRYCATYGAGLYGYGTGFGYGYVRPFYGLTSYFLGNGSLYIGPRYFYNPVPYGVGYYYSPFSTYYQPVWNFSASSLPQGTIVNSSVPRTVAPRAVAPRAVAPRAAAAEVRRPAVPQRIFSPSDEVTVFNNAAVRNTLVRRAAPIRADREIEVTVERKGPSSLKAKRLSISLQAEGDVFLKQSDFRRAASRYHSAVLLAPDLAAGHFGLGFARAGQGRLEEAAASFKKGLRIDPRWPTIGASLSDVYGRDNAKATADIVSKITDWTKVDIRDPDRLFLLGVFLHFANRTKSASLLFTAAQKQGGRADHLTAFLNPIDPQEAALRPAAKPPKAPTTIPKPPVAKPPRAKSPSEQPKLTVPPLPGK